MLALAQQGGYVSVRRMLSEIGLRELGMWAALWRIDPWGEERADYRAAITSSVIAETKRDPRKKSTPFTPHDFMPFNRKPQSVAAKIRQSMKKLPKRKG